jgi:pimeloyl-ACP methyl ester carboxylesterase
MRLPPASPSAATGRWRRTSAATPRGRGPGDATPIGWGSWSSTRSRWWTSWPLAARHGARLRSLAAISVPPPAAYARSLVTTRQGLASWYVYALQLPGLPERALAANGRAFSPRLAAALRRSGQSRAAAERDAAGLADPAALTAALNWYRGMFTERPGDPDPPVRVPTLFVWSDRDTALTRQSTELVHRHVAAPFRYVELRGVSHWVPDEAPDQLAELLLEHFAEHPA